MGEPQERGRAVAGRLRSAGLGLAYGRVHLVADHPAAWSDAFGQLATLVLGCEGVAAVEHVGSTAVPGLAAKPILDVAVAVAEDAELAVVAARLERLGFEFRGDKGEQGGLLFVLEDAPLRRVAHLHVVPQDSCLWRRYLRFRDRLRSDSAARAGYADLKRCLATQHPDDRVSYTAGKEGYITQLLDYG
jgi:GrpB-like predicted nucleotidyltransferase (UPF0157 family)